MTCNKSPRICNKPVTCCNESDAWECSGPIWTCLCNTWPPLEGIKWKMYKKMRQPALLEGLEARRANPKAWPLERGLGRWGHSCGVRQLLVDSGDLLHGGRHGFMVGWTLWLCRRKVCGMGPESLLITRVCLPTTKLTF